MSDMDNDRIAELRGVYAGIFQAMLPIGLKLGVHDPDFERASGEVDRLHGLLCALERARDEPSA